MTKKNNKYILKALFDTLKSGRGRVAATKAAGIHYDTFCEWMKDTDFSESVQKAEMEGLNTVKETCESVLMKAATRTMKPAWQAAAWMLERKFPEEYALQSKHDHTSKGEKITSPPILVQDQKTADQLNKLIDGGDGK